MPSHDFGVLLGLAYQAFVDQLHVELARHGFKELVPSYGYVLRAVAEGPINQRALSRRLGITDQGAGAIVAAMTRRRLLTRQRDPDDGRARLLVLAPRGEELLRVARRFHARFERDLTARLGAPVAATRQVLEAIAAAVDDSAHGRLRAT